MKVSPLSRQEGLEQDLLVAFQLKPDVLEIRDDRISEVTYELIQAAAEAIGCSLLLTMKKSVLQDACEGGEALLTPEVLRLLPYLSYVDLDILHFHMRGMNESAVNAVVAPNLSPLLEYLIQSSVQLIVSFHMFAPMPFEGVKRYVDDALSRCRNISNTFGVPVIPKIAVTPNSTEEALMFMRYVKSSVIRAFGEHAPWIGVPMGEASMSVRMMANSLGSLFTYAYLVEPNAPGQIPLYCLLEN